MLDIDIIYQNAATIITVDGEVDMYSSPDMRKTLLNVTSGKNSVIILNLEKVSYMDSSGLATLIEGLQETGKYDGKFILTNLREEVMDVFQLSRLDKVFEIYDSQEEALKNI